MVINLSCVVSHRFGNIFCHGCWGRNDQEDRPLTTHLATWRWIQGGKCHKQGRVLSPDCRKCGHSVPEIARGALKCTLERCKFLICQNEYHVYFFLQFFMAQSCDLLFEFDWSFVPGGALVKIGASDWVPGIDIILSTMYKLWLIHGVVDM